MAHRVVGDDREEDERGDKMTRQTSTARADLVLLQKLVVQIDGREGKLNRRQRGEQDEHRR